MIRKRCIIELKIRDKLLYVTKDLNATEEIEKAHIFIGKRKVKRFCDIIKSDKRVKAKIIEI